ncbi:MAG: energy transducer TonB [Polyangiales bacterium]
MVDIPKEEPPPPPPPEPEPQPAASPQAAPEAKATPEPPPPPAAKAGNLLTAPDEPAKPGDDPVSFVTDPDGSEYGSGVVQKGGTGDFGKAGAAASGVPNGTGKGTAQKGAPAPPPGPAIVATSDLSRKPSLPAGYSCKNFPADADDDVANVQVLVTVKPSGEVQTVSVMDEKPKGQGFGKAARSCVTAVKLTPGLDKAGTPVLTTVAISVHFSR